MALAETIAASELNYDRLLAWNDRYDAKVSLVLTLDTAMLGGLGVLASNMPPARLAVPLVTLALLGSLALAAARPSLEDLAYFCARRSMSSFLFFTSRTRRLTSACALTAALSFAWQTAPTRVTTTTSTPTCTMRSSSPSEIAC